MIKPINLPAYDEKLKLRIPVMQNHILYYIKYCIFIFIEDLFYSSKTINYGKTN
jgi:hypothetical protein